MLLSEYIAELEQLLEQHGDHDCVDSYEEPIGTPEFNDEDPPSYVLADKA